MENFWVLRCALGCKIILITMFEVWQLFSEGFLLMLKRFYVPVYLQIL